MELIKSIVGTFFRAILTGAGVWLVNKGYITESDFNAVVSGLVLLVASLGWSIYQKYKSRLTFLAALELPAGAPEEQAKSKASEPGFSTKAFLSLLVLVSLIGLTGSQVACARKPEAKSAVYSAQTVEAWDGFGDVIAILDKAKVIQQSPKAFYSTHDKIATSMSVVFDRVKVGGYDKKAVDKAIEEILADIERFERDLDAIKDPNAQAKLDSALFTARFTLNSVRAIIAASKEPDPQELKSEVASLQKAVRAPWWNDVILEVQNTAIEMFRISRMDAPTAWADAADTLRLIHEKNAERLAQ